MDVTSLLNSNGSVTHAAEQQNHSEIEKNPPSSRTPWDAGGYSLPINTISVAPSPFQHAQYEESRQESRAQTSPTQHRFSDSRSSLSSFTSSLQSTTHSRFSSMSTVNSSTNPFQSYPPIDVVTPKLRIAPTPLDLVTSSSHRDQLSTANTSPTSPLRICALNTKQHPNLPSLPPRDPSSQKENSAEWNGERYIVSKFAHRRSSSPSDAILIKRTAVPILRVNTGDTDLGLANGHLR